MADLTVTQLSAITSAASADELPIWQASSGQQKKISVANLLGTALVGSGTAGRLAEWGGASTLQASTLAKAGAGVLTLSAASTYTLTVPGTGTAAVQGIAAQFPNIYTNATNINDDGLHSFSPGPDWGLLFLSASNSGNHQAVVGWRVTGSGFCTMVAQPSNVFETSTAVLGGTVGTDGKVTISANVANRLIYIENRLGGTLVLRYMVMGS